MAEISFPFDAGPGADSYEDRWRRMARLWAPSGVAGVPGSGAYDLTVSGLTATIKRRTSGLLVAEAWVDGFLHRLTDSDWSVAVPVNTNANPRVDRIVLRLVDVATNRIDLVRLEGTPAASPVAPALTQVDNGVWETPLWRFTVPASSGAPLTGLVDERTWIDPASANPRGVVAYGSSASATSVTTTGISRLLGGVNLSPPLYPGRLYEYELTGHVGSGSPQIYVRALLGATPPASSTGTLIAGDQYGAAASLVAVGKFTVSTLGVYTFSPFIEGTGASTSIGPQTTGLLTATIRDSGPSAGIVGGTPIAVP